MSNKALIITAALLLATGVSAFAMSGKNALKFEEILATDYAGFQVNRIPESSNVFLLLSKEFVVIVAKYETLFGGVKAKEIMRLSTIK